MPPMEISSESSKSSNRDVFPYIDFCRGSRFDRFPGEPSAEGGV
jgi:hypothetical protein